MELRWLNKEQGTEAIVVFGGWAVGAEVFGHLTGPQDILFVSDYRSLEAELPDLSDYARVSLIAWSFGVASYAHWQQGRADPFNRKIAVNGSLTPVNRATGIPPVAMTRTIDTLSQATYQRFLSRVFNAGQAQADIDVEARRAELQMIQSRGDAPDMAFDQVWISAQDKIFPAANLTRAWAGYKPRQLQASHAPFAPLTSWSEILA